MIRNYFLRTSLFTITFILVAATKGWIALLLLFYLLPLTLLAIVITYFLFKHDHNLRNKLHLGMVVLVLLVAFVAPGIDDTSAVTAFTFMTSTSDSSIYRLSFNTFMLLLMLWGIYSVAVISLGVRQRYLLKRRNK